MTATLWIGTRKGAFTLRRSGGGRTWKVAGPQFLGHIVHHVVQDPREPRVLLMAAKTGHLGPTVYRSGDGGRKWREAAQPPAFRKAADGEAARAVDRVFWLTPGHGSERGTWYAGSSPAGLFRSEDGGERWQPVAGFNDNRM
ncbi:MAG: exo-alpha-sialidase, partial [Gammaproteobacteria bacterium]|nr:exo-alpha-sialidase [Gammaproteobacteria bacterium]